MLRVLTSGARTFRFSIRRVSRLLPRAAQYAGSAVPAAEGFARLNGAGHVVDARVNRIMNPVQHEPGRALHDSERVR